MPSLKVADLGIIYSRTMIPTTGSPFPSTAYSLGPDVLGVMDDALVLLRFNDDRSYIDFWRTRLVPNTATRNSTAIPSVPKGVYSEYIYKTLEATVDGIIDFTRDLIRIRSMRNVGYDREWHELKIGENFEVTLAK